MQLRIIYLKTLSTHLHEINFLFATFHLISANCRLILSSNLNFTFEPGKLNTQKRHNGMLMTRFIQAWTLGKRHRKRDKRENERRWRHVVKSPRLQHEPSRSGCEESSATTAHNKHRWIIQWWIIATKIFTCIKVRAPCQVSNFHGFYGEVAWLRATRKSLLVNAEVIE